MLASLEAARSRPSGLRLLASLDRGGDLLGANFPGLKLAVASGAEDAELVRREQWQRRLYYAALGLVMGATIFGAYLLWRDLRREVRLADLRAQFVSSVSHELRTPLTTIRMLAEGLQMKRPRSVQKQEEYLETIVNESERLTRLVEDLLQFSRIEQERTTYHFRPTALPEVVDAVVRAVQYPLRQRGLELRVALENGLPPLPVDRDALEQALLNLLTNACLLYTSDAADE